MSKKLFDQPMHVGMLLVEDYVMHNKEIRIFIFSKQYSTLHFFK